jgi:hypothetical protein
LAQLTISGVVRDLLKSDLEMPADDVIRKAKARGLQAPETSIRTSVHNIRSTMKRDTRTAPAAARQTAMPKPKPATIPAAAAPKPINVVEATSLTSVLANVALVNQVIAACGSAENARKAAEAVRSCGGVDAFLQHIELVAGIRSNESA